MLEGIEPPLDPGIVEAFDAVEDVGAGIGQRCLPPINGAGVTGVEKQPSRLMGFTSVINRGRAVHAGVALGAALRGSARDSVICTASCSHV